MSHLRVLLQIAFRNLFSSFLNLIIGAIILVGTMLVVVGSSMLDSLDSAMSRSITGSVAGHIQVYSAKSKDELSLYGTMSGDPDLTAIDDFSKVKTALSKIDNVKTIVPMGVNGALVTSGNTVDLTLAKLREAYKAKTRDRDASGERPQLTEAGKREQIESLKQLVRQMVTVLQSDVKKSQTLLDKKAIDPENIAALEKVSAEQFWADFDKDPFQSLEYLENRIAPQVTDADLLWIRYVGTDLDEFQKSFDRMQIIDGERVPPGQRGFLFSKFFYEEALKLKTARRLDKIKEAIVDAKKTIKGDPVLERMVTENQAQTREIVFQLDGIKTRQAIQGLQTALGSKTADLSGLLTELLTTNDENFLQRYQIFYEKIAPLVELYRVRVGDMLTIKAFTRSGYVQSVNVRVYGTFNFNGLEKSPLAGGMSLMDLMSFRDLYGYLSADKAEELKALQAAQPTQAVARDSAEAELFGGGKTVVAEATPGLIDEASQLTGNAKALRSEDLVRRVYSKAEIENGVVLNSALILKDPKKLDQTLKEVEDVSKREGLELKAISWQKASGLLGQFVFVAKAVLFFALAIIFVVAMVIINNAVMMATIQRTQVIGTMRAIGAQTRFVLAMVLIETLVLGLIFGAGGMALGAGVMTLLHQYGIRATNDFMYFFFSGPRLYPVLGAGNLIAAFIVVLFVTTVSTFIPALLATRVSPLKAMQADE